MSLTRQVTVRVTPDLRRALEEDAAEHGRTVAQSVRHILRRSLTVAPGTSTVPMTSSR